MCSRDYEEARVLGTEERDDEMMRTRSEGEQGTCYVWWAVEPSLWGALDFIQV